MCSTAWRRRIIASNTVFPTRQARADTSRPSRIYRVQLLAEIVCRLQRHRDQRAHWWDSPRYSTKLWWWCDSHNWLLVFFPSPIEPVSSPERSSFGVRFVCCRKTAKCVAYAFDHHYVSRSDHQGETFVAIQSPHYFYSWNLVTAHKGTARKVNWVLTNGYHHLLRNDKRSLISKF